jgi:type I restriction enzyme, S subunit
VRSSRLDLSERKIGAWTAADAAPYLVQRGDFFVARGNGSLRLVGRGSLLDVDPDPIAFPDTLIRVRPDNRLVQSAFLAEVWHAVETRQQIEKRAKTTAGIYKLNQRDLGLIELPLPPSIEQQRIVGVLESYFTRLDDAVATLERAERNLKRYRASVLKAAVEGRLVPTEAALAKQEGRRYEPASALLERILAERRHRWTESGKKGKYQEPTPPDATDLPDLPEGWCWATVDAVGDVLLGRQRAPQYLTGRHSKPYLRVANVKDNALDASDIEEMDFDEVHFEKYRLIPGDILVSEGQSPHLVGQSAIYSGGIDNLCFQKTLHRFRPFSPGPSSEFAQLVFRAHVKSGVYMRIASITTNIAHLTLVKFQESRFPLPPEAEQTRIVDECARLMSQIDAAELVVRQQLRRCGRLRQSILKWAFEGKLVEQDPKDEPASLLLERIKAERTNRQTPEAARSQSTASQKQLRA